MRGRVQIGTKADLFLSVGKIQETQTAHSFQEFEEVCSGSARGLKSLTRENAVSGPLRSESKLEESISQCYMLSHILFLKQPLKSAKRDRGRSKVTATRTKPVEKRFLDVKRFLSNPFRVSAEKLSNTSHAQLSS